MCIYFICIQPYLQPEDRNTRSYETLSTYIYIYTNLPVNSNKYYDNKIVSFRVSSLTTW